jgi:hypothetical protein
MSHNISPEDEHKACPRNTVPKFCFFQRTMGKVQRLNGPEGSRGTVEWLSSCCMHTDGGTDGRMDGRTEINFMEGARVWSAWCWKREGIWERTHIASPILNVSTRRSWLNSITCRPIYPHGKSRRYHLNSRFGGAYHGPGSRLPFSHRGGPTSFPDISSAVARFLAPGAITHNGRPWQKLRMLKNHSFYSTQ